MPKQSFKKKQNNPVSSGRVPDSSWKRLFLSESQNNRCEAGNDFCELFFLVSSLGKGAHSLVLRKIRVCVSHSICLELLELLSQMAA